MLDRVVIDDTISKEDNIKSILKLAQSICDEVFSNQKESSSSNYIYDYTKPVNELGLDKELIVQLLEDYISQVFKTYQNFHEIINDISTSDVEDKEIAQKELKNLAHKNLGVARNLRIDDAQLLLSDLMNKNDDLEYLKECVEGLMACTYKLNPSYAFNALRLIKVKNTL